MEEEQKKRKKIINHSFLNCICIFLIVLVIFSTIVFTFPIKAIDHNSPCGANNTGIFHKLGSFSACVDVPNCRTDYTVHTLDPEVCKKPLKGYGNLSFQSVLYGNPGKDNNQKDQEIQFKMLGIVIFFLSKCHYVPRADFNTNENIYATFIVENSFPGFHQIDGKNGSKIECKIRDSTKNSTIIITGTFGQIVIESTTGEKIPLKLVSTRNVKRQQKMPRYDGIVVPEYLYKIVIDTITQKSYVVVLCMNPYQDGDFDLMEYCSNVYVPDGGYLANREEGRAVFCAVDDFKYYLKTKWNIDLSGHLFTNKTVFMGPQEIADIFDISFVEGKENIDLGIKDSISKAIEITVNQLGMMKLTQ